MVIALVVLLIAGGIGAGINVYVNESGPAKKVATTYLSALGHGDFDTAYDQWCAADQALYPPAAYRAQHEYRQGEVNTVRGARITKSTSGTTAEIAYVTAGDSTVQSLALRRVEGTWRICPSGDRLRYDMENCGCMTASQHLDADIAFVLNDQRAKYPLNAVRCPSLSGLVDGRPVVCRGTSRDGRAWDIQAIESNNATYTNVKIRPATT